MRKHFLLLFLMTLLPLAGWAQGTDLSDGWAITFDPTVATYTGGNVTPAVKLTKQGSTDITTGFTAVWKKGDEVVTSLVDANPIEGYTVTVTANGTDTYAELAQPTKKFYVLKATPTFATSGTTPQGALKSGGNYSSSGYSLIETEPTVTFGQSTILYKVTDSNTAPASDAEGWVTKADIAKVYTPGDYYVWFKIPATANYVEFISAVGGVDGQGKASQKLMITGTALAANTDYEAPTALTADITFDNATHPLVNAGTLLSENCTGFQYSLDNVNWQSTVPTAKDVKYDGDDNVTTYTIYWKAIGAAGYYNTTVATLTATIVPGTPTVTSATGATGLEYNAADRQLLSNPGSATIGATPTYSIKYSAELPTDWSTVTSSTPAANQAAVKAKTAGYYQITTLVNAGGNYAAAQAEPIVVQIKKATLTVTADAKTKVYSATDPALTATYTGWKGEESAETENTAGTFHAATLSRIAGEDAGEYVISINNNATATNYNFIFDTANYGKFTITPKELNETEFIFPLSATSMVYTGSQVSPTVVTGTANDGAKYTYGGNNTEYLAAPKDFTYVAANNINAGTAQLIITGQNNFKGSITKNFTITPQPVFILPVNNSKKYGEADPNPISTYKLVATNTSTDPVEGAVLNGTVELARVAGNNVGTYKIYVVGYTAAANDNYKINDNQVTGHPDDATANNLTAAFTINPAGDGLKLHFKADLADNLKTKVYGNADPVWNIDMLEPIQGENGLIEGDEWETVKPTLSVPVFHITSQNVGEGNTVTVSNLHSTNYPVVTVEPLAFEVTARPIAITVKAQTIAYGSALTQDTEHTSETYWSINDTDSEGGDWNGTTSDELSDLNVTLSTINELATYGSDTYEKVIKATISNSNYVLNDNYVWGDLTVTGSSLVLSDDDPDVFTKIKAYNGMTQNVSIILHRDQQLASETTARTWKKEFWNSIVLPFDIDIATLSSKFGYAIFNVADADNTVIGKAAFKIEMAANYNGNVIPANTPLLIKTNKDIANATTINFGSVEIVAPESAQFGKVINTATGYKFMGTYEDMTVSAESKYADNFYFWTGTTNTPARIKSTSTQGNTWVIKPFSAYVDQTGNTPARDMELEFTYEELGGGTTAVRGISIDEINNANMKEGVYNLNGVKMNNVPTQKGIYIMNGKKVVVK